MEDKTIEDVSFCNTEFSHKMLILFIKVFQVSSLSFNDSIYYNIALNSFFF